MTQKKSENNEQKDEVCPLRPLDAGLCGYHFITANVAHPVHGKPCNPLICFIVDVVTRLVVGWAIGLTEAGQIVNAALKDAATVDDEKPWGGVFSIVYLDNLPASMTTVSVDEGMDVFTRLGTTVVYRAPGAPQGCGMLERLGKKLWGGVVQELTGFTNGRPMLVAEVDSRHPFVLSTWSEFIGICQDAVETYNHTLNKAFPYRTVITPSPGKSYYSPNEQWNMHVLDGWQPEECQLTEGEIEILLLPRTKRRAHRACIKLFHNCFYSRILEQYEGVSLQIGYDINDSKKVSVWDDDGRLICYAKIVNNGSFFPASEIDKAREGRAKRRNEIKHENLDMIKACRRDVLEKGDRYED